MPILQTQDGTELFFKDWGTGPAILFSHGWPLNADAFEDQMITLASQGFRCIAHDRRGHGRSSQPWTGNDMNTFADDLSALITTLDLEDVMLVGHSMGGGEVARYVGRYGTGRVSRVALIAAVTPYLLKTDANPDGADMELFDQMRQMVLKDRAHFFEDFSKKFYGANRLLSGVSQGMRDAFFNQAMQSSLKSVYDSIAAFSETDFTADLAAFDVPTLVIHGDDDQTVPLQISGERAAALIPNARLEVYEGAPHGLCATHKDRVSGDLLAFAQADALSPA